MLRCSDCSEPLTLRETCCEACGLSFRGDLALPRLLRLAPAHIALAEAMVLAGGNLKRLAGELEISYPTLRKRVDELILELQALRDRDKARIEDILGGIEAGTLSPARGTRLIREMNGEL